MSESKVVLVPLSALSLYLNILNKVCVCVSCSESSKILDYCVSCACVVVASDL